MTAAVVFDLDDTLYPESQFVRSGFAAADAWLRNERAVEGFLDAAWRLHEAGRRGKVFDEALAALGVSDAGAVVPVLLQVYRAHAPALELFPDARWALEHYRARAKTGLLTDGYLETQKNKVAALGLQKSFDALIYSDALGREHWKPSPAPFRALMDALPGASSYVYVADNPAKDFVAPRGLGWKTVQVRRAGGEYAAREAPDTHRPDRLIASLRELPSVLGI